jgi:hypothetical protein
VGLFGTGSAQFQKSGSAVVKLEYSRLYPEYVITDEIEHKSVLTGHKSYSTLGDYSRFKVEVNLFKYTSSVAKFNEIYQYYHDDVYFWPHSDGKAISGSDRNPVEFHIVGMELNYLDNIDYKDLLTVEFDAIDYTVLTGSLL